MEPPQLGRRDDCRVRELVCEIKRKVGRDKRNVSVRTGQIAIRSVSLAQPTGVRLKGSEAEYSGQSRRDTKLTIRRLLRLYLKPFSVFELECKLRLERRTKPIYQLCLALPIPVI